MYLLIILNAIDMRPSWYVYVHLEHAMNTEISMMYDAYSPHAHTLPTPRPLCCVQKTLCFPCSRNEVVVRRTGVCGHEEVFVGTGGGNASDGVESG